MATTKLSTKGQIVLPKSIRTARAWTPGTEFTIEETTEGVLLTPTRTVSEVSLGDVAGCLRWTGKPKTLQEMDEGVTTIVRQRHDRGRY